MPIVCNLSLVMASRGVSLNELSRRTGIAISNLSKLKCNRDRAIRFTTLMAICEALDCQPGDILEFRRQ